MAHVEDWATKAARKILSELHDVRHHLFKQKEARVAAVIATFAKPLLDALDAARPAHYHCDDSWYCCGKCTNSDHSRHDDEFLASNGYRTPGVCTCGADELNARIDKALNGE